MPIEVGGPRPPPALHQGRGAIFSLESLAPWIRQYAGQYAVRPELLAAVIRQESSYVNHAVHRDGTGHGLVGLDDRGLLPEFERWSGLQVGRGRHAITIPPEKQIEFLAMTLASYAIRLDGDEWAAVRAWHAGVNGRDRRNGVQYERLIRSHVAEVTAAVAPPPAADPAAGVVASSQFVEGSAARVRIDAAEGPAVSTSVDLGETT